VVAARGAGKPKRSPHNRIPKVRVIENANTLQFSFKHLDFTNEKYSADACCLAFWRDFSRKLCDYSSWTVDPFCDQNNEDHRHIIDFSETTETGFSHLDTEQLAYEEPWQFQVGTEGWRVAGFMLNGTFYIVWIDYHHRLYRTL
jgi:hypothetical protein